LHLVVGVSLESIQHARRLRVYIFHDID
jgi:hypothetical protein